MPHFVIMGAGRVGVMLARTLEASGHTVAVIDQDERAFQPLRKGFEGRLVTGVGFDEDTLKRAGITEAYAFAAVSSGDNSNIIAARVAREMFKVKNVVARVYDPNRAEFFQRMGIPTVASVRWSTDQVLRRLLPEQPAQYLVSKIEDTLLDTLKANRLDLDIRYNALTPDFVAACHAANIQVNVWTVDTLEDCRRMTDWGVDYITSNIVE